MAQLYNTDAVSVALAGCYSISQGGSSGIYNEATMGIEAPSRFHFSHVRPFVIKELGISTIGAQFPLFPGKIRIEMLHYGIPGYQQVNSSLGYGMHLAENIYAGVGFRYYNTISKGEWSYLRALGVSGGILAKAGESTWLSAHVINPVTISNYTKYGDIFPSIITLGIRREIYSTTRVMGEVSYHVRSGFTSRIAVEHLYSDEVILRAGYHSNPATLSFGTGILIFPLKLDIAFAYSVMCGVIPALTITYLHGK